MPISTPMPSPACTAARFSNWWSLRQAKKRRSTVKPASLMEWLVGMVTPPGGLVLDPFVGSGSTGIAALREGIRFINPCLGLDLLAGQGTVALELLEQVPDMHTVVICTGGGGLLGGMLVMRGWGWEWGWPSPSHWGSLWV